MLNTHGRRYIYHVRDVHALVCEEELMTREQCMDEMRIVEFM